MKNDMTTGSEWKRIIIFSLPIMAGQLLQQLYSTIDGIVVGNYVSEAALAAVGTCTSLTMVFLAAAMGLSNGAGIMIAQFYGAKRIKDLREAASTAFIMLAALGVVFSVAGVLLARPLVAGLMNVEAGEIQDWAVEYFAIYAAGLIFQFGYNAVAYILRAIGDSKATLYFLCISSVMNLVLDLVFVIVFGWGVAGAAIATVIAQIASMVASIIYMNKKYEMLRFKLSELRFVGEKCRLCLKLGIPTTLQQCVVSFGNVFIQRLINGYGQFTMAACTVGNRIESYTMVPIMGLNMGMSNFTGQNIGAGKHDRIKRGLRATLVLEMGCTLVVCACTFFFAGPLSSLFGVSGEAMGQAIENIRFQSLFFVIFSAYFAIGAVIQGSGDVMFSTLGTLSSLFCRVVFSYLFAYGFNMDYHACWYSLPIGWVLAFFVAFLRYRSGAWKSKGVVHNAGKESAEAGA